MGNDTIIKPERHKNYNGPETNHRYAFPAAAVQFVAGVDGGGNPIHLAALVTAVVDVARGVVMLVVFNPTGQSFVGPANEDMSGRTPGTWHWPFKPSPIQIAQPMMVPEKQ